MFKPAVPGPERHLSLLSKREFAPSSVGYDIQLRFTGLFRQGNKEAVISIHNELSLIKNPKQFRLF